ncbi:MAG: four helix bundle suffix domain-containing protein [Ginsengibacter sp.]
MFKLAVAFNFSTLLVDNQMENEEKNTKGFIPTHGGFRNLFSYQKAEIIFDGTAYFTSRFFQKYDRTIGQMVQAARSGKQNIAEASMASGTSKEMEIKLTNVARASQAELLLDYEDFLRIRKLPIWDKDHRLVARLRELNKSVPKPSYETFRKAIEHENPEICANTMITLINITIYLLGQNVKKLEADFLKEGGLKERMTKARLEIRKKKQ